MAFTLFIPVTGIRLTLHSNNFPKFVYSAIPCLSRGFYDGRSDQTASINYDIFLQVWDVAVVQQAVDAAQQAMACPEAAETTVRAEQEDATS